MTTKNLPKRRHKPKLVTAKVPKLVCENVTCRGNAPCATCRLFLSLVIRATLDKETFVKGESDVSRRISRKLIAKHIERALAECFASVRR